MSWVEVLGFVTGALCVALAVRQNVWNFPIGIANNLVFIALFVTSGLYSDAGLQVVYIGLGLTGWWAWQRGGPRHTALLVRRDPRWGWAAVVIGTAVVTWGVYELLSRRTDSTVPLGDALTTALSLVAQVMLNRKWIGNWVVWIVADVLYVGLYASKGLWLTAALYAGFIGLCVVGLRTWRRALRGDDPASAVLVGQVGPVGGRTAVVP